MFVLPSEEHQAGGVYRSEAAEAAEAVCSPAHVAQVLDGRASLCLCRESQQRVGGNLALRCCWRRLFCTPVRASALNGLVRGEWRSFHAALMIRLPVCAADLHVRCIRVRF